MAAPVDSSSTSTQEGRLAKVASVEAEVEEEDALVWERLPHFALGELCDRGQHIATDFCSRVDNATTYSVRFRGEPAILRTFSAFETMQNEYLRRILRYIPLSDSLPILRTLGVCRTAAQLAVVTETFTAPDLSRRTRIHNLEWSLRLVRALEELHRADVVLEHMTPQTVVMVGSTIKFDPQPYYGLSRQAVHNRQGMPAQPFVLGSEADARLNNVYGIYRLICQLGASRMATSDWAGWVQVDGQERVWDPAKATATSLAQYIEEELLELLEKR